MHSNQIHNDLSIKIQHKGLKKEVHIFEYQLNGAFFANFENSIIQDCNLKVLINFDKRLEPYHAKIQIDGTVKADCDKCNATFPMTVLADFELYIKYIGEHNSEEESETEIIFITRDEPEIDFTKLVYDLLHLSMPIYKVCNSVGNTEFCDKEILKAIDQYLQKTEEKNEQATEEIDPRWAKLQELKNKLN